MKRLILVLFAATLLAPAAFSQKAEVKDVISKHLSSIVSADRKKKLTNLTAVGDAAYSVGANYQRKHVGKSVFVSDGRKVAIAMTFPLEDYKIERMTFNGKDLNVAFVRPGTRSALGSFLDKNNALFEEGLFGGVLSTGWTFHHPDLKKGAMSLDGTKKIDGRDVNVISYSSRSGSGATIKLYFDVETGRHVRTTFRRVMSAQMARDPDDSARQSESIEELTEDFGDFKTEDGVTLPRSYTIKLDRTFAGRTSEFQYAMTFASFYYDQQLDAATFELETKY